MRIEVGDEWLGNTVINSTKKCCQRFTFPRATFVMYFSLHTREITFRGGVSWYLLLSISPPATYISGGCTRPLFLPDRRANASRGNKLFKLGTTFLYVRNYSVSVRSDFYFARSVREALRSVCYLMKMIIIIIAK